MITVELEVVEIVEEVVEDIMGGRWRRYWK